MWDEDEDNNPYGHEYGSDSEYVPSQPQDQDLDSVDYDTPTPVEPKKGGYSSRIEQMLYENPDLEILITNAGKNTESGGSYIAYTIQTGVSVAFTPHNFSNLIRSM